MNSCLITLDSYCTIRCLWVTEAVPLTNATKWERINTCFKDGDFKNHILNENNIPITKKFIESVFKKYNFNHKVKNLDNFQLAMIHVSYLEKEYITEKTAKMLKDVIPISKKDITRAMPLQKKNYGRLEYLGDSVIHAALARYLFDRFPEEGEGFLTKTRIKLEKDETLSKLSKKIDLGKYAVIARNIEQGGGRENNIHLTEDIFEAFIGALSLEIQPEECYQFIIKIIESEIDIAELINSENNYKDMLMHYFHQKIWGEPKYNEDVSKQKNTKDGCVEIRSYTTYIKDPTGKIIGIGEGNTKSKSEQSAAHNALYNLEAINDDDSDSDYYGELSDDESDNESDKDFEYVSSESDYFEEDLI